MRTHKHDQPSEDRSEVPNVAVHSVAVCVQVCATACEVVHRYSVNDAFDVVLPHNNVSHDVERSTIHGPDDDKLGRNAFVGKQ